MTPNMVCSYGKKIELLIGAGFIRPIRYVE
jgi:hypothetical protein